MIVSMVRRCIRRLCPGIALTFAIACASVNTVATDPMEIELDAFSGRPNPTWVASPEQAASVSRALTSLRDAPAPPEPGHLGYRGFIIRQRGMQARVYGGHVSVTTDDTSRTFADSAGLEQLLIADANQRGFAGVISPRKQ
jgi:hypothetical protein